MGVYFAILDTVLGLCIAAPGILGRCHLTADLWALYLVMRQQNIDLQWPQVAFSGVAPFLDPDIHAGATLNFPEKRPFILFATCSAVVKFALLPSFCEMSAWGCCAVVGRLAELPPAGGSLASVS